MVGVAVKYVPFGLTRVTLYLGLTVVVVFSVAALDFRVILTSWPAVVVETVYSAFCAVFVSLPVVGAEGVSAAVGVFAETRRSKLLSLLAVTLALPAVITVPSLTVALVSEDASATPTAS